MGKAGRAFNVKINTPILQKWCANLRIKNWQFSPKCYRLSKYGIHPTVDVYLPSMKCFFHDVKSEGDFAWGEITDLEQFLKFQFSDDERVLQGVQEKA